MTRYHPLLVLLHWLLAMMIVIAFFVGAFVLEDMPNTEPGKIDILKMHMGAGMMILALMVVRLLVRRSTQKPPHADTGNALLNRLGPLAHIVMYVVVFGMCLSGMGAMMQAGLYDIVYGGSGQPLPQDFDDVRALGLHETLGFVLFILVIAHLAAALYHQLFLKDGLFRRMWFGKRGPQ